MPHTPSDDVPAQPVSQSSTAYGARSPAEAGSSDDEVDIVLGEPVAPDEPELNEARRTINEAQQPSPEQELRIP